jgi:hypothetical protein
MGRWNSAAPKPRPRHSGCASSAGKPSHIAHPVIRGVDVINGRMEPLLIEGGQVLEILVEKYPQALFGGAVTLAKTVKWDQASRGGTLRNALKGALAKVDHVLVCSC